MGRATIYIVSYFYFNPSFRDYLLLTLFTELLNSALLRQRSSFLQKSLKLENKANGFYQNELLTSIGKLNLKVPYPNSIKTILKRLELPFSYEVISEIKESLLDSAAELNSRPIRKEYLAVFIDAYQGNREGLIKDEETPKDKESRYLCGHRDYNVR